MERVELGNSGVGVSRLGFGCVSLTMHDDPAKAVRVLEAALDAGITHFDTARLYGSGRSEEILGAFLKGKRERVTVATKFGKEAPAMVARGGKLISLARWVAHRSKFVMKLAKRSGKSMTVRGKFDPASVQASLETSLRALGTDCIDLYMAHDCKPDDAGRDDLIALLNRQVEKGTIRAYGAAVQFGDINGDADVLPSEYGVVQFSSDAMVPNVSRLKNTGGAGGAGRTVITCRAVKCVAAIIEGAKKGGAGALEPYQSQLGVRLTDPHVLAGFLLRDALARNPRGAVLFATTDPARVRLNVELALNAPAALPADHMAVFGRFVTGMPAAGKGS
jgi:hypothetical protein